MSSAQVSSLTKLGLVAGTATVSVPPEIITAVPLRLRLRIRQQGAPARAPQPDEVELNLVIAPRP